MPPRENKLAVWSIVVGGYALILTMGLFVYLGFLYLVEPKPPLRSQLLGNYTWGEKWYIKYTVEPTVECDRRQYDHYAAFGLMREPLAPVDGSNPRLIGNPSFAGVLAVGAPVTGWWAFPKPTSPDTEYLLMGFPTGCQNGFDQAYVVLRAAVADAIEMPPDEWQGERGR